ncbi:flagellar motor protein MotA [Bacteroidia bacterium]|nr:flagellar motor protein MotA [Bacteroidia bacterium]
MKRFLTIILLFFILFGFFPLFSIAQDTIPATGLQIEDPVIGDVNIFQAIKVKFVAGGVAFMSIIALTLVIGLAFCLERIIYLSLAKINTKKFLSEIENQLNKNDWEEAKTIARNTRGPVASICYQALDRINEEVDVIEKSIVSYGSVQVGLMEKNLSWITLFIAIAPSLGFLGTVIGMIQSFDNIQLYGDINPTIVAGGMKVALITTVGGLIVALILQVFYNFILNKMEGLINGMEDDSIGILDLIIKYKKKHR